MLLDEPFQIADERGGSAERELGLGALLDRHEAKLFQCGYGALRERLVGEVAERGAVPQIHGIGQQLRAHLGCGDASVVEEPLEAVGVHRPEVDREPVAVADGLEKSRWCSLGAMGLERLGTKINSSPRLPCKVRTIENTVTLDFLGTLQRTHMCGELRASDAGKRAILMGWVHRRRDLGGVVFIHRATAKA